MSDRWTTENIPDLSGKVVIVTGGNSGIGYEAAKEFARKGAQTILACRSMDKAQAALNTLKAEIPNAPANIMQLDLASLASVRQFAAAFKEQYDRLDILVNNAGIMAVPYGTTEDGFEKQLGTNHLGHYALTGLLLDVLKQTPGARVVSISSTAHRTGNMNFDNLMYENGTDYTAFGAYGRSKLANLLFTSELQKQFQAHGVDATALAAHPGGSNTNLQEDVGDRWYFRMLMPVLRAVMQSAAMGALPTLRAAVDPSATGGEYYGPSGLMEMRGYPVAVGSSDAAKSAADAQKLWDVSQELTGVSYQFN